MLWAGSKIKAALLPMHNRCFSLASVSQSIGGQLDVSLDIGWCKRSADVVNLLVKSTLGHRLCPLNWIC